MNRTQTRKNRAKPKKPSQIERKPSQTESNQFEQGFILKKQTEISQFEPVSFFL